MVSQSQVCRNKQSASPLLPNTDTRLITVITTRFFISVSRFGAEALEKVEALMGGLRTDEEEMNEAFLFLFFLVVGGLSLG